MAFLGVGAAIAGAFFEGSAVAAGVVDFAVTLTPTVGIAWVGGEWL
jgi:hypothetical protein